MVLNDTTAVRPPARAARPSTEEIDTAILDAAAELFARHGFAGTSVQQVADVVGYSKTGLLRRFPSKQALYDGVVDHVADLMEQLAAQSAAGGPALRVDVLRSAASACFAHPGAVMLLLEVLRPGADLPGAERLDGLAHRLLDQLTVDMADGRDRVRAVLALQLVTNAALLCVTPDASIDLSPAQVHDLAVDLAGSVLGTPVP